MDSKDKENKNDDDWFNLDQLIAYMKVPATKKLDHTEEVARFFFKLTPEKNKKAWLKLKEEGF